MADNRHEGVAKSLFLIPNALTTLSMFFGFYSILSSFKGELLASAAAIIMAVITDGLDGRLARLTNTQSAFGKEFDSLADMVAFAVAPALAVYCFVFQTFGKLGWSLAFIYMAATGLRLAMFNVRATALSEFVGLACPTAAVWVVSTLCVLDRFQVSLMAQAYIMGLITLSAVVLMVSTWRYPSFKQFDYQPQRRRLALLVVIFALALILLHPPIVLCLLATTYAFYAPISHGIAWLKRGGYTRRLITMSPAKPASSPTQTATKRKRTTPTVRQAEVETSGADGSTATPAKSATSAGAAPGKRASAKRRASAASGAAKPASRASKAKRTSAAKKGAGSETDTPKKEGESGAASE